MTEYVTLETEGDLLNGEASARDVLETAMASGVDLVVIPVARLHADMLNLSTRQLGLFLQKLVNYHRRIAILGYVSVQVRDSKPFRDFVYESNKGHHVWFVENEDVLREKLGAAG